MKCANRLSGLDSLKPTLAPKQQRLARAHPVTHTVAGCSFQQHGVPNFPLLPDPVENDAFNPVAYAQNLAAEIRHGRREEEVLMLAFRIERGFDLIERLHANEFAGPKVQRFSGTP
jgi:hypothetical protein